MPGVCIYQRYMPPDASGAGKQALTLAHIVREAGWDVSLLTDGAPDQASTGFLEGVPIRRVAALPADASHAVTLAYWARIARALHGLRRRFDVLHVHSAAFHQAGAIPAARALGKRVLVRSSLSGEFAGLARSRSGRFQKRLLRLAGAFVVLSKRLGEEYLASGLPPGRLHRIPNGVDTTVYHPVPDPRKRELRRELGLPTDGRLMVFHGVFMERKSLHWLVQVLDPHLEFLDLKLLLVGGAARDEHRTAYARRLTSQIDESAAGDRIIVRGYDPEVHRYLQAADSYILPSTGEGLSNALLEAMAVGLTPVVTRTGGSEDVIEDGISGLLFDPRDPDSLLQALYAAYGTSPSVDPVAIGRAAAERVEKRFSIRSTGMEYVRLYQELTA